MCFLLSGGSVFLDRRAAIRLLAFPGAGLALGLAATVFSAGAAYGIARQPAPEDLRPLLEQLDLSRAKRILVHDCTVRQWKF